MYHMVGMFLKASYFATRFEQSRPFLAFVPESIRLQASQLASFRPYGAFPSFPCASFLASLDSSIASFAPASSDSMASSFLPFGLRLHTVQNPFAYLPYRNLDPCPDRSFHPSNRFPLAECSIHPLNPFLATIRFHRTSCLFRFPMC